MPKTRKPTHRRSAAALLGSRGGKKSGALRTPAQIAARQANAAKARGVREDNRRLAQLKAKEEREALDAQKLQIEPGWKCNRNGHQAIAKGTIELGWGFCNECDEVLPVSSC